MINDSLKQNSLSEKTGLSPNILEILKQIFEKYNTIEQVKLYGSRAKGTFNDRSDIDLVAYGEDIEPSIIANVLLDLDDSDIPYLIDFQDFNSLKNYQLIEHINRVGIQIYSAINIKKDVELSIQQLDSGKGIAMEDVINEISSKYK